MTRITKIRNAAFEIEGRGTAVLSGVSAEIKCPFQSGQKLFFKAPNGELAEGVVKSVEFALLKTAFPHRKATKDYLQEKNNGR
jgi:hypothetical protein